MAALVDANILVYRFDGRFPKEQKIAVALLGRGIIEDSVRLPHQAIVEFVVAVTRPIRGYTILKPADALREAEEFLHQFAGLYPNEAILRDAVRGCAGLPVQLLRCAPVGLRRTLRPARNPHGGSSARSALRDGPRREAVCGLAVAVPCARIPQNTLQIAIRAASRKVHFIISGSREPNVHCANTCPASLRERMLADTSAIYTSPAIAARTSLSESIICREPAGNSSKLKCS